MTIVLSVLWFTASYYQFGIFSFLCCVCRSLFVFFLWPLYCLSFDLQLLTTSLVSLVFCVMFCRSLFVFFLWPLYCLSFLDLQLLTTSLVSLVFCVVFNRSLFVLLYFFFWSLYYLSFDLRLVITPLVSSNIDRQRLVVCLFILMEIVGYHCFNFLFTPNKNVDII